MVATALIRVFVTLDRVSAPRSVQNSARKEAKKGKKQKEKHGRSHAYFGAFLLCFNIIPLFVY